MQYDTSNIYDRIILYSRVIKILQGADPDYNFRKSIYLGVINYSMCSIIGEITARSVSIENLDEIMRLKPTYEDRWSANQQYWFAPDDKFGRLELLKTAILIALSKI